MKLLPVKTLYLSDNEFTFFYKKQESITPFEKHLIFTRRMSLGSLYGFDRTSLPGEPDESGTTITYVCGRDHKLRRPLPVLLDGSSPRPTFTHHHRLSSVNTEPSPLHTSGLSLL